MLSSRCVGCNAILKDYEFFFNENIQDYNDLCLKCLSLSDYNKHNDAKNFVNSSIGLNDGTDEDYSY